MNALRFCQQLGLVILAYSCRVTAQTTVQVDDSSVYSTSNPNGIQYTPGDWSQVTSGDPSQRYQDTYTQTKSDVGLLFFAFRGTSIAYFADKGPTGGDVSISIDGGNYVNVTTTNVDVQYKQQIWTSGSLTPGDHQIVINNIDQGNRTIGLDYLAVTSESGSTSIYPQNYGPGATNVPPNAVVVDDQSDLISYSGSSWDYWVSGAGSLSQGVYFNNTEHYTQTPGAQCTFTFNGTAVWYFTDDFWGSSRVNLSIDGGEAHTVDTGTSGHAWVTQKLFWGITGLSPQPHTLTVTHAGIQNDFATIDFFMYLPSPSAPAGTANPTPTTVPSESGKSAPVGAIAGGVAGGIVILALLIAILFILRRRRSHWVRAQQVPQHETYTGQATHEAKGLDPIPGSHYAGGPALGYQSAAPYTDNPRYDGRDSIAPTTWTGATYAGYPEL